MNVILDHHHEMITTSSKEEALAFTASSLCFFIFSEKLVMNPNQEREGNALYRFSHAK